MTQWSEEQERAVRQILEVVGNLAEVTDETMVAAFERSTNTRIDPWKVATLVPLAFGRVLLAHMNVVDPPKTFVLSSDVSESEERSLQDEPVFLCALQLAVQIFHSGPRELFERAALHGPEVRAINQALNAGNDIAGAKFNPTTITCPSRERWNVDA